MKRPLTVDDLWRIARVGGLAIAPDGARAACTLTEYSMARNDSRTQLWLLDTHGAPPRRLTSFGHKDGAPAWSPRGDRIAFVARREQQGRRDETPQLYVIDAGGGEAWRASDFAPGIESFRWLPDGRGVLFAAWVWPDAKGAAAQARRHAAWGQRKESGRATGEAQYRYWDRDHPQGRVLHLLRLDLGVDRTAGRRPDAAGRVRDLFEGTPYELERDETLPEPYDASPDGTRVVFAFDPAREKRAGNRRVIVEMELATRRTRTLADDAQWDFDQPRFAPDGRRIAVLAAQTPLRHTAPLKPLLVDRVNRQRRELGAGWDHEAFAGLRWSADGGAVYVRGEARGRCHLWRCDVDSDTWSVAHEGGWVQGFDVGGAPGRETIVVAADAHDHPVRVHVRHGGGAARRIERFNDRLLSRLSFGRMDEVTVTGALGDAVQMWLTYPVGFDARRRHAVLHVVHGGPQIAAGDTFGYRWNMHLLAAGQTPGVVIAQVNYHGSTSFGHAFKDAIVGRLGELEAQDIEAGTDWLRAQRWVDAQRIYAAGASYGGFLVAWLNGHAAPRRYRAAVCHAGVFDRIATFAADSYLARPKDLGAFYWDDMARVLAQSPHAAAARMSTPTLVTHGALDYRVPDANGLAYYNTLKVRGIDARLLWFPDENHWVQKPCNSRQWYAEVFAWLARHGAGAAALTPTLARKREREPLTPTLSRKREREPLTPTLSRKRERE